MNHPTMGHPVEKIGDVFSYRENGKLIGGIAFEVDGKLCGLEWICEEDRFFVLETAFALRTLANSQPMPRAAQ